MSVTAVSTTHSDESSTAIGSLTIQDRGVAVALSPRSAAPGSAYIMTVTNTGSSTDTFDLALAGPAGLVSTLGTNSITLAPGASRTISVGTADVPIAVPGPLNLIALARSHFAPDVGAADSADLLVAPSTGMTAFLSPPAQTLPAPGPATFQLQVKNTGNLEDEYSATISGTNGPVTASLVGLDGQPAQSISRFRLTGLSSGTITLNASLTGPGSGIVTIVVTSLSTGQSTTLTANLAAITDGPKVVLVHRYGIHMMPTTIVLTFDQPLDPARARDVRAYHLTDPRGGTIAIRSAVYDPATLTVTLLPSRRVDLHIAYTLTVDGASPRALTDSQGAILDGNGDGSPGGDYVSVTTGTTS